MVGQRHLIQLNIFGARAGDLERIDELLEKFDEHSKSDGPQNEGSRGPSAYVTVFEDMINTVYEGESHLLSDEEWEIFNAYRHLSYNSRYCLVRLLHRKANQWHPLSSLNVFKKEVGEHGVLPSLLPLCLPVFICPTSTPVLVKEEYGSEPEIIDLTLEEDNEDVKPNIQVLNATNIPTGAPIFEDRALAPDTVQIVLDSDPSNLFLDYFCQDETHMSLPELLNRMTRNDLVALAKQNKCVLKPTANKSEIISGLLLNATTQSVLNFGHIKSKAKTQVEGLRQTQLSFPRILNTSRKNGRISQEQQLRIQALQALGKCFRVNQDFYRLARRVHIIAYRATEHPVKLCLPALMSKFKKWAYSEYVHRRDRAIWSSRQQLLEYERALELEILLEEVIDDVNLKGSTKTPARRRSEFKTPVAPGHGKGLTTLLETPQSYTDQRARYTSEPGRLKEEQLSEDFALDQNEASCVETPQEKSARLIVQHLESWIFSRWQDQLAVKREIGHENRPSSLERFEPGHVYTRMVHKTLASLAKLKEYQKEIQVINALLQQRTWRRGKRATLYERRAIIQTQYICCTEDGKDDMAVLWMALAGVKEALVDDDTALVSRPSLLRRLRRLEKKLKVPFEERARCDGELRKAEIVEIKAKRLFQRAGSLNLDATGKVIKGKENTVGGVGMHAYFSPTCKETTLKLDQTESDPSGPNRWKWKGKSIWEGRNGAEVNVEERALQHYEELGFKGLHSETSILTTMFALLFWDIIFADVRGAFETPYQLAPLDIAEDSFYLSRKAIIDDRLAEIENGKAVEILAHHYSKYRDNNTWCIGLRWDLCEKEDLIHIVECIGGTSLSLICSLFCEDYAGRSSGGPDLIIWNYQKGICKFVEVKGPGDSPRENQKLWFDSLLRAGVDMEICKVIDLNGVKTRVSAKGKSKVSATPTSKKRKYKSKSRAGESFSEPELEGDEERDYDRLDPGSESEDPLPNRDAKRRRMADPDSTANEPYPHVPDSTSTHFILMPTYHHDESLY